MYSVGFYNDSVFIGCPDTHVPYRGDCYPKFAFPPVTGCYAVKKAGGGCIKCDNGYYLDATDTCVACLANCIHCLNATFCARCKVNFILLGSRTAHTCQDASYVDSSSTVLYSPRYQSVYPATRTIFSPTVPMTLNGTLNYTYSTTIPVPVESTVLIHAKVVFTDSGNAANNIYSHHDVMVVWNKPDGTKEYLQTRSLPYDPTHTFPKGPLKLDVVMNFFKPPSLSITIVSLHQAEITDFKYSVIQYDITQVQNLATSANFTIICNRNLTLKAVNGDCEKCTPSNYGSEISFVGFTQASYYCGYNMKFCSENKLGCAIECNDGYLLMPDRTCSSCTGGCLTCDGNISTNCTSCSLGKNLTVRVAPDNLSTCHSCGPNCKKCDEYTFSCTTCKPSFTLDLANNTRCLQTCTGSQVVNDSGLCLSCNVPNCASCSANGVCGRCANNFTLNVTTAACDPVPVIPPPVVPTNDTGSCSVSGIEKVSVSMNFERKIKRLVFVFSKPIKLQTFLNLLTLEYDSTNFTVAEKCEDPGESAEVLECIMLVSFKDKSISWRSPVTARIATWQDLTACIEVESRTLITDPPISYYDERIPTSAMETYSKYSSTAIKAAVGISMVSTSGAFSSLLKLTQYIELYTYLNINMPDNLKAFLQYFSEDIFNLLFNPFASLPPSRRRPPLISEDSGLFLQTAGDMLFFLACLAVVKLGLFLLTKVSKHRAIVWMDSKMRGDFAFGMFDAIFFELLLSAVVNLASEGGGMDGWESVNVIISCAVLLLLLAEMLFIAHYCVNQRRKFLLENREKSTGSNMLMESGNMRESPSESPKEDGPHNMTWKSTIKKRFTKIGDSLMLPFLTEPIKLSSPIATQYILIQQIKVVFSVIVILAAINHPLTQVLLVSIAQCGLTVAWLVIRPYKAKTETVREHINSVLLSLVMISSVVYTEELSGDPLSPRTQYQLWGFIHIIMISGIFLIGLASSIYEIVHTTVELIKNVCSRKNVSKVEPVDQFLRASTNFVELPKTNLEKQPKLSMLALDSKASKNPSAKSPKHFSLKTAPKTASRKLIKGIATPTMVGSNTPVSRKVTGNMVSKSPKHLGRPNGSPISKLQFIEYDAEALGMESKSPIIQPARSDKNSVGSPIDESVSSKPNIPSNV